MSVIVEATGRTSAWRNLPKEVRRRLRRSHMPRAEEARALVDWARTRWRRAAGWAELTPGLGMTVIGLWLFDLHLADGRLQRLVPEILVVATMILSAVKLRYANTFAVITTDAATVIEAARPEPARPLVVRRRAAWASTIVDFAVAGMVSAGWTTHLLTAGTPWTVLRTIATVIFGGFVALAVNDGITEIRRSRRNGGVLADLDREGIRLAPNAPKLPWSQFSGATLSSRWGVQLILTGRSGPRDTVTIDAGQTREEQLDVLLTVRRFIAASAASAS